MNQTPKIDISSIEKYMDSSIEILKHQLDLFFGEKQNITKKGITLEDIKKKINEINAYPNIKHLQPLKKEHVIELDESAISTKEAENIILNGQFFWEHAAAGEATRLGLGPKYFIDFSKFTIQKIQDIIINELKKERKKAEKKEKKESREFSKSDEITEKEKIDKEKYSFDSVRKAMGGDPKYLLPLKLGSRHMFQMAYDIAKLAKKRNLDPKSVLSKQKTLVITSESSADKVTEDFEIHNFFGLNPNNVFFMIQRSFHGINIETDGRIYYEEHHNNNRRLHNHGQMVMQKAHDNVIFFIDSETKQKIFLSSNEFEEILKTQKDMVSYNIEDIGYLTSSIDWSSLALALRLSKEGYEMMMEIVAQNPLKPQKGGAAFFDTILNKVCMIESNRLLNINNEDITHLNKNFNHYPNPSVAFRKMKERGLHMPFEIKETKDQNENIKEYIYFNPVQGDLNFNLKTAYVMRKELKSIQNLKSPATIPPTIKAMFEQDKQEGFKEFVDDVKKSVYL